MLQTLDELIANLDRSVSSGFELPFLKHGETAFVRLISDLSTGALPQRAKINALYVLFALLECCPDRASSVLDIAIKVAREAESEVLRSNAAMIAVRVALLARHPRVDIASAKLQELRVAISQLFQVGISIQHRDFLRAFLDHSLDGDTEIG